MLELTKQILKELGTLFGRRLAGNLVNQLPRNKPVVESTTNTETVQEK